MKYLEITGRVPLPDDHRKAAALIAGIDTILTIAEGEIQCVDEAMSDFEFDAKQRTERPASRGPRAPKVAELS
ncbi:MAG: hypothetical protein AB7H90_03375 [Alphaproteobacteria bacterium]